MSEFHRPFHSEAGNQQRIIADKKPFHLPELSLYITDSCALSCSGCISFNNYALGSHLELDDLVEQRLRAWANSVSVDRLYVIGGEPLSHPGLDRWMAVAEQLWPTSRWTLCTNGRGLESQSQAVALWLERGWDIEVSSHSREDFDTVQAWWQGLTDALAEPIAARRTRDQYGVTDYWEDSEGRPVMQIGLRDRFHKPTHTVNAQGQLEWAKLTAPRTTHSLCGARNCTQLVNGVMYSCPVQATLPTLARKYEISGPAGEIARVDTGYDPLKPRMSLSRWMATLGQPKDQCRLCSWPRDMVALGDPSAKKVKLARVSLDSLTKRLDSPASLVDDEHLPEPNSQA